MAFNASQRKKIIVMYALGSARSTFEAKLLHSRNSHGGTRSFFMGQPKLDLLDLIDSTLIVSCTKLKGLSLVHEKFDV